MSKQETASIKLMPADNSRLAALSGPSEENLQLIEERLKVHINYRGNKFSITGAPESIERTIDALENLYALTEEDSTLTKDQVHLVLTQSKNHPAKGAKHTKHSEEEKKKEKEIQLHTYKGGIKARTSNQKVYLERIFQHTINFGVGPAGTGKTFLAVACAVDALEKHIVQRLILVRPAVEAGERLGFLPGDLTQKVDPYLRPIYDALYELMGFETVDRLLERNVIEIAPLAYMRGRTLNDAFVILDEAQNTTIEQMKMFLTRIGFGSKAVITGDVTQVDLAKNQKSGLIHAQSILQNIDHICFTEFNSEDVVRHPVVQKIIEAYDKEQKGHED